MDGYCYSSIVRAEALSRFVEGFPLTTLCGNNSSSHCSTLGFIENFSLT